MITCELTGRNFEIDAKVKEYVEEKIGNLDHYLPRRARENVVASVMLENDPSGREDNRYVCEVLLTVDGSKMVSREGTVNMFAAIDIVEAKLQPQCRKYKEKVTLQPRRLRMLTRWISKGSEPEGEGSEPAEQELG